MKAKRWSFLILVVVLGMVLAACGGDGDSTDTTAAGGDGETTTSAGGAGGEDVTLRVLVHQNPPMVAFMEAFNDKFEADNPN
ncbi:MAG: hypothetical protein R6W79_10765, partial [Acidimicrobiia bacterium]